MIEHLTSDRFRENARAAVRDDVLRGALRKATDLFAERRGAAVADMSDWEELRERGRAIKAQTLARLDHYLEQFVAKAEALGVRVHWARDSREACRIVMDLAREKGASTVVKSKSMTTEEIGLNQAMEQAGLHPVETDLGEWIIQLAGEKPSHIIAPAIHKTKEQIADLFAEKLDVARTDDIQELTLTARGILRRSFAEADLGISGVNFAVAETGSILILENEGNIRMTTSLPRVHLAVMGIEKVIPEFADLEVFLRLLPRSGTGQHLSSYQSILTGPVGPEAEGPRELHILLLDNGRSPMLDEPVTRQSLACIRCGACLNVCPVYKQVGGHAYGSVYPGPIGAVITPQLAGLDAARELPFASTLCGACRDACPVKIDIPALLLHLRSRIVTSSAAARGERRAERLAFRAWAFVAQSPWRYRFAARVARALAPLASSKGGRGPLGRLAQRAVPALGAWSAARELRPLARRSFRELWSRDLAGARGPGPEPGREPECEEDRP